MATILLFYFFVIHILILQIPMCGERQRVCLLASSRIVLCQSGITLWFVLKMCYSRIFLDTLLGMMFLPFCADRHASAV
ncbi:membrane-associated protein, putative [Bodo saltans]|uniref:Membrane-associated protein, putative n=1 Tax=Bodo saltans TaxID=75058 RepID=A0A0S4J141_BODSA|nr:membrane-associated protein, putative [Bodo saltans]|eukprot:CUG80300.1 membrane-associated protein, putative [Bodo saltans]